MWNSKIRQIDLSNNEPLQNQVYHILVHKIESDNAWWDNALDAISDATARIGKGSIRWGLWRTNQARPLQENLGCLKDLITLPG
jgi:hypothetical protein